MKPSWKGSLTFGLVDINVELYSAIEHSALSFHLLHTQCLSPLIYRRWCTQCEKEVPWEEIEKGLKLKDGTYFVMSPENLKKLRPHKTSTIDITEFVDSDAIDPLYYDAHYYALPSKDCYHAFSLFVAALDRMNKAAIGQFVLRDKAHLCAIRSYHGILLLTTLNYAYEIKKIPHIHDLKLPHINTQELALAKQLINGLSRKTFDIKNFKDTFVVELVKKIASLRKGKKIAQKKKPGIRPQAISLLKALETSLGQLKNQNK